MPTMVWSVFQGILIAVHGEEPPSDEDWDRYMETAKGLTSEAAGGLVVSDGGGPNAAQRKKIAAAREIADVRTAVVTSSVTARGIVTAIGWFGKKIRAFAPDEIERALDYLEVKGPARADTLREVACARARLIGEDLESLRAAGLGPDVVSVVNRTRLRELARRAGQATQAQ